MDYRKFAEHPDFSSREKVEEWIETAETVIVKLLARAEAAEADRDRLREALKPNCLLCDSMHENGNCTEVGGFCTAVPAAHCPLIPKLRAMVKEEKERAEKAERERDEYFKHLQGRCFCCAHKKDGFDCRVKCYGNKRGSAWVYSGPREE